MDNMDFYEWNTSANTSGTSTPVSRDAPGISSSSGVGASTEGGAGLGIAAAAGGSSTSTKAAGSPTLEQELEQMGTFVSGMSKNWGSYWGQLRRQVWDS